jgi:hypothetical protein
MNGKLLNRWKIKNLYSVATSNIVTYCLILPLYAGENPVLKFNERTLLGIDEFLFSAILGTLVLFLSLRAYHSIKEKNGKPHFPFERVVLPIGSLVVCSVLMNYLGS